VTNATQDEFVELVNTSALPVDISGFTISDSVQVRFTIPASRIIPAGEAAVIFGGGIPAGDFGNAAANGLVFAIGGSGLSLNNAADSIIIKNSSGIEVARLDYPPPASDIDQSITRNPDITGNFVAHLTASGSARFSPGTRINGRPFVSDDPLITAISPEVVISGSGPVTLTISGDKFQSGAQVVVDSIPVITHFVNVMQLTADIPASIINTPGVHQVTIQNPDLLVSNAISLTVLGSIGINEFLADPADGPAGDANGDGVTSSSQDEFIEIVNRASSAVDLSGFTLSDATQIRFTFPVGAVIPSGEAAVVFGGGNPSGEFGNASANGLIFKASLSLNNTGDTITLKDAAGNTVEQIVYASAQGSANQSVNRNPEIVGVIFATHSAMAESGGRLFSPGAQTDGSPFTIRPHIEEISPDRAPLDDQPLQLSIRGSGFESGSQALIDGWPVPSQLSTPGLLIATVPAAIAQATGEHTIQVRNANGNQSNVATLTIIPPPPELISTLPRQIVAGAGEFTIFITGMNFTTGSVVMVEGNVIPTTFRSPRELSATVPDSFTASRGTCQVRVRNIDGAESGEKTFEVVMPAARIASISPGGMSVGSAGFTLLVKGADFHKNAIIIFDQTPLETEFISATELRAEVPASLLSGVGLRSVAVQNNDGQLSNDAIFAVVPDPPALLSLDPHSVIEGASDTTIKLRGEKFQSAARVRLIENGRPGRFLDATSININQIESTLPAALLQKAGKVFLRVENPDSGISNTIALDVLIKDPLVINEFLADPPDGAAGDANGDGARSTSQDEFIEIVNRTDEAIDISGYRVSDADSVRHVFAPGTIVPAREAVVVFGGGTPTGRFGNAAENGLVFKASSGGLSLNNGGDRIKLETAEGRTLQEIAFGSMEGNANQSINRSPDLDGAAFVPHSVVALHTTRLFSPGAKAKGESFTIKPFVRLLTPASIRAGSPSFSITVQGENFQAGVAVLFGSTELATVHRSNSELEAEVNAELIKEGGRYEIRVRNPKGEISSPVDFVVFDDPPRIASISPDRTGTGAANLEVTVTGERFQREAIATVKNETVETRFVSRERIVIIIPDRFFTRATELEVQITNEDGNSSNQVMLRVDNGPLITRLSQTKIKAGRGEMEITIGGVAFKDGATLLANDIAIQTRFVNENALITRIPAGTTQQPGTLVLQVLNPDGGRSNKASVRVIE